MDKRWINLPNRLSKQYLDGVDNFLDFALANIQNDGRIYRPCKKCCNRYFVTREMAREHLIIYGFLAKYKNWINHREKNVSLNVNEDNANYNDSMISDDMVGMIHDGLGIPNINSEERCDYNMESEQREGPDGETLNLLKLLQEAECSLYSGCENFTALSFIVCLLHLKVLCGWTDKSITMLLGLLKESYPKDARIPKSYYDANKITTELGFTYNAWDACRNNCMIFKNEDEKLDTCDVCGTSRYKQFDGVDSSGACDGKKIPIKQVRFFPLKPRLQRLFMSSKTVSLMKWHVDERTNDDVLRHPTDTLTWKDFV